MVEGRLAQTQARVHAQVDAGADRTAFGRERDSLAAGVQVAPAFGEAALALERRAPAVAVQKPLSFECFSRSGSRLA
jgi:hypothetical protein